MAIQFYIIIIAVALFIVFQSRISSAFGDAGSGVTDFFGGAGKGITDFFDQFTDPLDLDNSRGAGQTIVSSVPLAFADDEDVSQRGALTVEEAEGASSIVQNADGSIFVDGEQVRPPIPEEDFLGGVSEFFEDVGENITEFFEDPFNIPEAFGETTPSQSSNQNRNQQVSTPAQSEIKDQQFELFGTESNTVGVVRESEFTEVELRSQRQESEEIKEARALADASLQKELAELESQQVASRSADRELQRRADEANQASQGEFFGKTPEQIALELTGGNISNF